jgi:uncharacterized membrane protein
MEHRITPEAEKERTIYSFFEVLVFAKGAQGIFDLVASVIVYLIPLRAIVAIADHFTEDAIESDPDDFIANHIHDFAHNLSIGGKEFAALYLLLHGIIKLGLAIGLLSGKRAAYPIALVLMALLIVYQSYRIWLHYSPLLIAATIFDCSVFYIIAREFMIVRKHEAKELPAH